MPIQITVSFQGIETVRLFEAEEVPIGRFPEADRPGLDLSAALNHGQAVLLAWASGYSPIRPMNQFTPRRSQRDTLWRVVVPVE